MDKDKLYNDLTTSSENSCIEFGKEVKRGNIDEKQINDVFDYIKSKKEITEDEAIITIKNIVLSRYYVPFERTDFITPSGEALLHLANFIKIEGSPSFKILYALYKYQIDEEYNTLKYTSREELVDDLKERFSSLTDEEKKLSQKYREKFYNII